MPIYEYQCPDCSHRFERMQRMSDDPVTVCPTCGEQHVKKLVSMTSFVLKGEGWYKDHYGLKQGGGDGATAPKPVESAATKDAPAGTPAGTPAAPAAASPATPAASPAPSAPAASSSSGGSTGGAA